MKNNVLLPLASVVALLLFSLHMTHDIIRGNDRWGPQSFVGVLILFTWLCGALLLPARRSGRVIMFLTGLGSAAMPLIHRHAKIAATAEGFFFAWTLFVLGAVGLLSMILAIMRPIAHENPDRRG